MRSARFEPVDSPGPAPGAGPAPVMGGPDVEALMAEAVQSGAIPPGADPRALLKEAMQSGTIPPGVDAAAIQRLVMQHAAMRRATTQTAGAARSTPVARRRSPFLRHVLVSLVCIALAAVALAAHQHYRLTGQTTAALVSLLAAGGLALVPLRAILHGLFAVEGTALHAAHGIGSLAFVGLGLGGVVSGAPIVSHAAMAPFAIMGAAQAIMHQDHPRNAQQAAALRAFATSLPEVSEFTSARDLSSPANAARAVRVLTDLIGKAEVLGETELQADPAFQSAWSRAATHGGLTLGLDAINQGIDRLAANPATASAVPALRQRLAQARRIAGE